MGRIVYAEEGILPNLLSLARSDCYEVGLIIGQTTGQRDYVIHLARTPRPVNKEETDDTRKKTSTDQIVIKSVKDIQENWIADHAKHVTRMLPGGVWILGVFTVGPGDIFSDSVAVSRLQQSLIRIKKHLSANKYLYGDSPSEEKLLLHLDSNTRKWSSRLFNTESGTGTPSGTVDWKFQGSSTKWHQVDCQYQMDQIFPITESKVGQPVKKMLQDILSIVEENVRASICMINGKRHDPSDNIENLNKKDTKKLKGRNTVEDRMQKGEGLTLSADLYLSCSSERVEEIQLLPCGANLKSYGMLASRVFLHHKATVAEAIKALKEDIVRSLAARLELHWDSLIEEEQGCPEDRMTLHEPPRRVLVPLPHCRVALSDYLFPGEGPTEALVSLQELLDLDMSEDDVQKELEEQADPCEFCTQEPEEVIAPVDTHFQRGKMNTKHSAGHNNILLGGLIAAGMVLAVSVAAQLTGWLDQN